MSKRKSKIDPFAAREAAKYERPIPSREFILEHLKHRGTPAHYEDLHRELNLNTEEEYEALYRRLRAMVRDAELERLRGGHFWPAGQRILLKGKIHIEKGQGNRAWVIPEDGSARVLLSTQETRSVCEGNLVIASVIDIQDSPIREGNLVEILEQEQIEVTGRLVRNSDVTYVIPHGRGFTQDILIPAGKESGALEGHIVVVQVRRDPTRWSEPIGQIVEILGHEHTAGIEIQSATRAYKLREEWPEAVLEELGEFTHTIPAKAKHGRLDIRHLPLITIDGEDARDFDDAVYCQPKPRGGWQLYVAIADVSYYVKPDSALDREAKERGNSVYFPGKVIPMLPEILSNDLCSLNPDVDRLCMVCVLNISHTARITGYEFHEGLMRSTARLTYTKVAALLEGTHTALATQYADILPHIQELSSLYHSLKAEREARGAIEFETSETRVIFGENGKMSHIEPVRRTDAHRIIEECMLCANVATARFLKKHKLPGLYRVHEGPAAEKLADLKVFLAELGLGLGGGKAPKPMDYAYLLRSIQDRPDANVIQWVLLRSLSQAVYSPDNRGHFGLAYPAYSHFTSPIRRYPDLWVHRQIRMVLRNQWTEKAQERFKTPEAQETLVAIGDHTSMTERRADDATRDALRWLKCEYIQKRIGDIFEGVISGVTRFGFFVELKDLYIDGLVHMTSLQNDYYVFDNLHHRLVGERSGIVFRLGDQVNVKVAKVDVDQRRVDFEWVAPPALQQPSRKSHSLKSKGKFRRSKEARKTEAASNKRSSVKNTARTQRVVNPTEKRAPGRKPKRLRKS